MILRAGIHRASQGGPSHPRGTPKMFAEEVDSWAHPGLGRPTFRVLLSDYWDLPRATLYPGSESPVPSNFMWGDSLSLLHFFLQGTCEMKWQWTRKLNHRQKWGAVAGRRKPVELGPLSVWMQVPEGPCPVGRVLPSSWAGAACSAPCCPRSSKRARTTSLFGAVGYMGWVGR